MIWNDVPVPVLTFRTVVPESELAPPPPPQVQGAFESTVATALAASAVEDGAIEDAEGETE
jgi:uncharacterized membrane protein YebE (DUF533 family)